MRTTPWYPLIGLGLVLATLLPAPTTHAQNRHTDQDAAALEALFEEEWRFRLEALPEFATAVGVDRYNDRMTRVSDAERQRRADFWRGIQQRAAAFDCAALEREACINLRLFRRQIDHFIESEAIQDHLLPFNSDWGFYLSWTRWPEEMPFDSVTDYQNYLSRLDQLPAVMDEYIALLRRGLEQGFTQPRAVLDGRAAPIRAQLVEAAEDSAFYAPFAQRPDSVPEAQFGTLRERGSAAITDSVVPAYRRLLTFLEQEYLPGARQTLAAHALPGGERFYAEQIRWYATVDPAEMTPQMIHQTGLDEVARITREMEAIQTEVGFEGSLSEFIESLRNDPRFYADSPRQLLAEASYWSKKMDGRLPRLFGRLPRQPYGVAPVPEAIAPFYTAGRYVGAPLSARRGGYYWVNTHDLASRPLYALPALTLHEAVPGHHLQNALALEQAAQPPFRRNDYISSYGEGWALYAEKLGVEAEIYETPYQHFGRLTYEMWRACRLVIDTGIHAMDWSREQARDYLATRTALSRHEIATEVDRYISWPGQALAYKLGELKIVALRREAESRLGSDFDVRAFHDHLLALGAVPLAVLEDEMRRWIGARESQR